MTPRHIVMSLFILSGSTAASAAEPAIPPRTVSVSGTHVTHVVPDMIVWRVNTSDFDKNLQKAKESSDSKLKAILKLREELGVKPEDAQTGYLSIEKEFERDAHGNRGGFKHFVVRRSVTLTQRDLKRFDEFLSRLVGSAEIEASYNLESSRFHEVRADTRLRAVRIARQKAAAMTRELGEEPGKVLTLKEYSSQQRNMEWFPSNSSNGRSFDAETPPEIDVKEGTFAAGSIEVRVTVEAVFEIK